VSAETLPPSGALGPKEIAARLSISLRLAQVLMASGEIESFRVGGKVLRATSAALDRYVAEQLRRARARGRVRSPERESRTDRKPARRSSRASDRQLESERQRARAARFGNA